jgi:hypothetical protein
MHPISCKCGLILNKLCVVTGVYTYIAGLDPMVDVIFYIELIRYIVTFMTLITGSNLVTELQA